MAIGKNGGLQNQNQYGNSQGTTNSTSTGTQTGTSTGTSAGTTDSTSNRIISDDWWRQYGGLGNTLGTTGVTSGQQGNIDALQGINNGLSNYTQSGYYGLGDLAERFGGQWATPTAVTAPTVSAQTGASFMQPYQQGYTNDVVNTTLGNYDRNTDRQFSGMRARRDASGAFGDRAALADNQFLSDSDMNRAQTEAQLRDQGFTRGMQGGMSDAGNFLSASNANAANSLAAQTFNNNLTNNRQQFDVNTGFRGDEQRMGAFDRMGNNILAQSGIQSGGIGNLMNLLGIGQGTFGQQNTGTQTGTQTGSTSGTTTDKTDSAFSGSTTGGGSSRNKGGSLSLG